MSFIDSVKKYKEVIALILVAVSSTVAANKYFVLKVELEELSCQLRWRIQYNSFAVSWFEFKLEEQSIRAKIENLDNKKNKTDIEKQYLSDENSSLDETAKTLQTLKNKMAAAAENTKNIGSGGKCTKD